MSNTVTELRKLSEQLRAKASEYIAGSVVSNAYKRAYNVSASRIDRRADEIAAVEHVPGTDEYDFRVLADHIINLANPPDQDAGELWIMMVAIDRLANFVESQPCHCPTRAMDDAHLACPRCSALGRYANKVVDR